MWTSLWQIQPREESSSAVAQEPGSTLNLPSHPERQATETLTMAGETSSSFVPQCVTMWDLY